METLLVLWKNVRWKDFVDIFIVAFLIYQLLINARGTRAIQMFIGIGLLLMLFWLGLTFELYSLNWILTHFFDSFFLILIVIFQDQIRNALARFGTGTGKFGFSKDPEFDYLEEIVEACTVLKKEKIGTLIVIERSQGLLNYTSTGTSMTCDVHSDVLYAIFETRSPIHDGAVIISDGKIEAVGCFLPLSKNIDIDKQMGTRHRAGIGITENTDAVSIIVSEETGSINVAIEGVLYYCKNQKALRQYLRHLVAGEKLDSTLVPIYHQGELR